MKRAETGILVSRTRHLTIPPASGRTSHMRTARMTMIIALTVAAVALPTAAGACDTVDMTVTWAMPTPAGGWAQPPTRDTATWPQTLATGDECGGWSQVDVYQGLQSEIDAILEDEQLTLREDSSVVQTWSFVEQQPCPTLEQEQEQEQEQESDGGAATTTTTTTSMAGAAVPAAASPRFAG